MYILESVNELSLRATCTDGHGALFTKAGAMIAYRGNCNFEKVLLGPQGNPVTAMLGQIGRRFTGENMPLMKVKTRGQSESYYANLAQHVTVITLPQGMSLCVESENLLAFTDTCNYSVKFLAQGVISQKGLFTTVLTGAGPGAQVAITTEGNPILLDTPCCVDPDAHIAHVGADPSFKLDLSWKNLIGQASGESYMFEYKNHGGKVIVQPSERKSGLDISIDSRNSAPPTPSYSNNTNNNNNQNDLGNILGNIFR